MLFAASVIVEAVGMAMAVGVDNGVYETLSPAADRLYFNVLMALGIIGPLSIIGLLFWFAKGKPSRQLG